MNDQIKSVYRVLEERYVKVAWTHKIQECQACIHLAKENKNRKWMAAVNAITTTSAVITLFYNVIPWVKDEAPWIPVVITAGFAVWSSYLTFRYKDQIFATKAAANKQYAAKCHDMRNKYESILSDVYSGRLATLEDVCAKRDELVADENNLYSSETAPHTTAEAVKMARKSLMVNRDSQTEDNEIRAIVPHHLQIL